MEDRIRISDADRDRVAARLREHFAEGRLSSEELDERLSAAFSAKTVGDLRPVTADLPDPGVAPSQPWPPAPWAGRRGGLARRGPRVLPLALLALIAAALIPGAGWLLFAALSLILAFCLVAVVGVIVAAALFRHRLRRHWRSGASWHYYQWPGPLR